MKKFLLAIILSTSTLSAHANLSNEQLSAALCILANQGIHTAASERQAGASKQTTKAKLDKDLTVLRQKFKKHPQVAQGIQSVWYRALDTVYQKPVYKTQAEKNAFVSGITQEAFRSCMENLAK